MSSKCQKLNWREEKNGFVVDCSLDIAVHSADSKTILLIIPGVDGSLDGFENKYLRIADKMQKDNNIAVVRMSNPFISSYHWESNIQHILEFIQNNATSISGRNDIELRIMAHSAGASVIAQIAWEYPLISRLLLINPAMKLGTDKIEAGFNKFNGEKITIITGDKDPSIDIVKQQPVSEKLSVVIVNDADHNFSGEQFQTFLDAPQKYLFY